MRDAKALSWRRWLLTYLALPFLLVGCKEKVPPAAPTPSLAGAAEGWNVLLVTVDTLRADRLNSYGYDDHVTSPNIDNLLSSGIRFANANSPRALTWPSLATTLTGLYPSGHGVIQNGYNLPDDLPTLPKILDDKGYETAAYLSNMCQANHQGWDTFRCSQGRDGRSVQWALEWMDEQKEKRPYFLWVHLFGAHGPYYNGGEHLVSELDPDYQGDLVAKKWRLNAVMKNSEKLDQDDIRRLDAIYDAAVIGTDRLVARLLDGLKDRGGLEKTLVVFLADHGEDLYQHHGYIYHACSVYQSTLHVPLGISAPGLISPGSAVTQAVELSDVAPTLLDLLAIEPLQESHGVSLRPYLERPTRGGDGKPAFSEYGDSRIRTAQFDGWKLVVNPDSIVPVCFADGPHNHYPIGTVELYDLESDPLEQVDLAEQHPGRVAELKGQIRQRFSNLENRAGDQDLSDELKEELRSLGYVAN
ncbi:MAG: sulfatase-like hydrolase/transferase [Deltaproteobacteria bacterium]|nr:sulfatase-like hydrolase/transferase [Deltaproteobacteria bacterium]